MSYNEAVRGLGSVLIVIGALLTVVYHLNQTGRAGHRLLRILLADAWGHPTHKLRAPRTGDTPDLY